MKSTLYLDLWLPQSAQQILITLAEISIAMSCEYFSKGFKGVRIRKKIFLKMNNLRE